MLLITSIFCTVILLLFTMCHNLVNSNIFWNAAFPATVIFGQISPGLMDLFLAMPLWHSNNLSSRCLLRPMPYYAMGSVIATMFTNGDSTVGVYTTATLWGIHMAGICSFWFWFMAHVRGTLSSSSLYYFSRGCLRLLSQLSPTHSINMMGHAGLGPVQTHLVPLPPLPFAQTHIFPGYMCWVSTSTHFLLEPGCGDYPLLGQTVAYIKHVLDSILTDSVKTLEMDTSFDTFDALSSSVSSGFLYSFSAISHNSKLQFAPRINFH